jgi:hypothetical protein
MKVQRSASAAQLWRTWRLDGSDYKNSNDEQPHKDAINGIPHLGKLVHQERDDDGMSPSTSGSTLDKICCGTPRSVCSTSDSRSTANPLFDISPCSSICVDSPGASTVSFGSSRSSDLTSPTAMLDKASHNGMVCAAPPGLNAIPCAYSQVNEREPLEYVARGVSLEQNTYKLPEAAASLSASQSSLRPRFRLCSKSTVLNGVVVHSALGDKCVSPIDPDDVLMASPTSKLEYDFPLSQDEMRILEDAGTASTVRKRAADVVRNHYVRIELEKMKAKDVDNGVEEEAMLNRGWRTKLSKQFTALDVRRKCSVATDLLRSLDMDDPKRALVIWFYKFLQTSAEVEENKKIESAQPFFKKKAKGFLLTWISDKYKIKLEERYNWSIEELCVALNSMAKVLDMRRDFKNRVDVDFRPLLPRYTKISFAQEVFACQVCIHGRMCVAMCVCVGLCVFVYVCMCVCVCVCVSVCVYVCVCLCD